MESSERPCRGVDNDPIDEILNNSGREVVVSRVNEGLGRTLTRHEGAGEGSVPRNDNAEGKTDIVKRFGSNFDGRATPTRLGTSWGSWTPTVLAVLGHDSWSKYAREGTKVHDFGLVT